MSRLRVGVLLDSEVVPAWVAAVLEQVDSSSAADVALLVVNAAPRRHRRLPIRLLRNLRRLLYVLYERLDYRCFRVPKDAFARVDLSERFAAVKRLPARPVASGRFGERFDERTIAALEAEQLDVILRFGFGILHGEVLSSARYGVWSFHHGDNHRYRGGPPHFWEIYDGNPVTGTVLQILTEDLDAGRTIYRSQTATQRLSLYLSRNAAYWKSVAFVRRRLEDVHRHGFELISSLETYREPPPLDTPVYHVPTNAQMLRFFARLAPRIMYSAWWRLNRRQWLMAYRERSDGRAAGPWTIVEPPRDRFFADPFLIERGGSHFLFFEDFSYRNGSGRISYVVIDERGTHSEPRPALERPYHLSYPSVFERDGTVYMLPETFEAGQVELYHASRFPDRWELDRVLLPLAGVDPTLFEHGGKLWLFLNVPEEGAPVADELSLFFSDSLGAPWTPHPRNPVVSDARRARPAGGVFLERGNLIRPSQDSSTAAFGVVLNRIDVLSEADYREVAVAQVSSLLPGTHTYNAADRYEAVDWHQRILRRPRG